MAEPFPAQSAAQSFLSNATGIPAAKKYRLSRQWLLPLIGLFAIVIILWIPFGFQTTGSVEEWGVSVVLQTQKLWFLTENGPLSAQRIRPLEVVPYAIASILTPDSYFGYSTLLFFFYLIKAITAFAIFRRLIPKQVAWAFMVSVLFLVYPADSGLFAFRVLNYHAGVVMFLIAVYLLILYWQQPHWYLLLEFLGAEAISLLTIEASYAIIAATPLLLVYLSKRKRDIARLIRISLLWYVVLAFIALRAFIIFTQPQRSYESSIVSIPKNTDAYVRTITDFYQNIFIRAWSGTISSLNGTYIVEVLFIALITFAISCLLRSNLPRGSRWPRYFVLFLIGFAFIFFGFAVFSFSLASSQTLRVFLYSSLGAALCIGCVIGFFQYIVRKAIVTNIIFTVIIAIGTVGVFQNHAYWFNNSLAEQRLLGQLAAQAPDLSGKKTVLIFDTTGHFQNTDFFASGLDLKPAVQFLYQLPYIAAYPCGETPADAVQCTFMRDEVSIEINVPLLPPTVLHIPYNQLVLFDYTLDRNLQLLHSVPKGRLSGSTPATYSLSLMADEPPPRVHTLLQCWPIELCTEAIAPSIKAQDSLDFDFKDTPTGSGWRNGETNQTLGSFRWSVDKTSTFLTLLRTDQDYSLELQLIGEIAPDVYNSLKIAVNGQPIDIQINANEQGLAFVHGNIPRFVVAENPNLTEITFTSDLRFAPGTTILLGMAYHSLKILPLEPSTPQNSIQTPVTF